jgi:large exoprotein involved in heme utilization and adhesion
VLTNWVTLDLKAKNRSSFTPATNPPQESAPTQILEAQGWVINNKGEVVLTATAPNVTPDIAWVRSANCQVLEPAS